MPLGGVHAQQENSDGAMWSQYESGGAALPTLVSSFSNVVPVCEVIEAAVKASEQPSGYLGGVAVGDQPSLPFMAPHSWGGGGQEKARQSVGWRYRWCTSGHQCKAFAAVGCCCGQRGHFWCLCPALTPNGSARSTAHPSDFPPTSSAMSWGIYVYYYYAQ